MKNDWSSRLAMFGMTVTISSVFLTGTVQYIHVHTCIWSHGTYVVSASCIWYHQTVERLYEAWMSVDGYLWKTKGHQKYHNYHVWNVFAAAEKVSYLPLALLTRQLRQACQEVRGDVQHSVEQGEGGDSAGQQEDDVTGVGWARSIGLFLWWLVVVLVVPVPRSRWQSWRICLRGELSISCEVEHTCYKCIGNSISSWCSWHGWSEVQQKQM